MELAKLVTEQFRRDLADLDQRSTEGLVDLMVQDEAGVPAAVIAAQASIITAVDAIVGRLRAGGRLVYVGAGTAGRIGLLDAAECGPTFNTDRVVAVLAGGTGAALAADEAAEDDAPTGASDVRRLGVDRCDAVVGISASGRTPYTIGAVRQARAAGALTVGLSCNPGAELSTEVDHAVEVVVGPEVIAGSTRLKAGTAQKLALNVISTVSMIRLGKTFGNLMVDMRSSNDKLRDRAQRMVAAATGAGPEAVTAALRASGGEAKTAIVSLLAAVDVEEARRRLADAGGVVRAALAEES